MKFFFPDAQDFVDPSFDFRTERRADTRRRHHDDQYAHEVFSSAPFDGLLVSKAIVDGVAGGVSGKYSIAQRHRLLRLGARSFFRLNERPETAGLETIGDCGAFSYVREARPPFSVDDVIDFYEACGFDYGISVDHVILEYDPELDGGLFELVPGALRERQAVTLELAREFLHRHTHRRCRFTPMGVAQGWSPASYAHAVRELQAIGFRRIALGGMVPLKTHEILATLAAVDAVRAPATGLHLLGISRVDHVERFSEYGVVSFDSTSPLRRAFKDDKENYFTLDRTYTAVRVPQVEGNPKLQRAIVAGQVNQAAARRLERACLEALERYDLHESPLDPVLDVLEEYEHLYAGTSTRRAAYREVLGDRPWATCPCDICRDLGVHVVLFRGAERNRRRGFHNVFVFHERLRRELGRVLRLPTASDAGPRAPAPSVVPTARHSRGTR